MRPIDDELAPVHAFARVVNEYVELVSQDPQDEIDLRELARLLCDLTSAGLALPDVDEDAPDLETSSRALAKVAAHRFRSLASIVYKELFDPLAEPEQESV